MLCLSIKSVWAHLIISGAKNIENRDWATRYRGTIAVHASKTQPKQEWEKAQSLIQSKGIDVELPPVESLVKGAIIGTVDIIDCVEQSPSPWFIGQYGFVLANPKPFPPYPAIGKLNFFEVNWQPPTIKTYGTCNKCQGAIVRPGLSGYLCEKCGDIKTCHCGVPIDPSNFLCSTHSKLSNQNK